MSTPPKSAKEQLRGAADDSAEKIAAFFLDALEAEKSFTKRVRCDCKRTHDVEFVLPDWTARANAIDKLLSYGYGKPAQQKEEPPAKALKGSVSEASDEELEALLGSEGLEVPGLMGASLT